MDNETTFTAALLHDLGKVLLAARFPRAYRVVRHVQLQEGLTWVRAQERLDLAGHWNLLPLLTEVIGRHHQPYPDLAHWTLVALVHLADPVWKPTASVTRQSAAPASAGRPNKQAPTRVRSLP